MGRESYYFLTNLISEDEKKVITSIIDHIERGEGNVGIQQIANENFVSPALIVKFCKRLGFEGYRELFYHLATQIGGAGPEADEESPLSIIDNYSDESCERFCSLLSANRDRKLFAVGTGLPSMWPPTWYTGSPSAASRCSTACIFMITCCSARGRRGL